MSYISDAEQVQRIIEEECASVQSALFVSIQRRVRAAMGKHVKVCYPDRNVYAARIGLKPMGDFKLDFDTHQRVMVMPVCQIEITKGLE